jgi:hypothetical protein
MGLTILGLFLVLYGAFCLVVGLFKQPAAVWNMGKIQGFRKILKDVGTQIFISVWGAAGLGVGIWLLVR